MATENQPVQQHLNAHSSQFLATATYPEIAPAPLLYRTGFAMGLPLTVDETVPAGLPYGLIE